MIKGYVENRTERSRFVFKRHVTPGMRVSLDGLYDQYKKKFGGSFDGEFLDWLEKNKVPDGFEITVEDIIEEEVIEESEVQEENIPEEVVRVVQKINVSTDEQVPITKTIVPSKLTSRQISELKQKDNPRKVIQRVMSIQKLRRAKNMCKGRAGKETLIKLITQRIDELK